MKDKTTFKTTVGGQEVELTTIAPNTKIANEADMIRAAAWAKATRPQKDSAGRIVREALLTRGEIEKTVLPEHDGIWSDVQRKEYEEISLRLVRNEKRLKSGGIKLGEAAEIAWSMRADRDRQLELRLILNRLNENSAESFADNARLHYLVYACTQKDGRPFYSSLDDYYTRANEPYSLDAVTSLLKLINDVDDIDKTPENDFLYSYGFVDKQYRRLNSEGKLVDENGKLVNDLGQLVDEDGNLLDIDGDKLTPDGEFDVVFVPFTDDEGNEIKPKVE